MRGSSGSGGLKWLTLNSWWEGEGEKDKEYIVFLSIEFSKKCNFIYTIYSIVNLWKEYS